MNRIHARMESIDPALAAIPRRIRERAHCDWLIGADPVFVGLHKWATTDDGRAYNKTAHCTWSHGQRFKARDQRVPTIVLPERVGQWVIIHEFAHVLDEALGFAARCTPCTQYAQTNRAEAFAEAFTAWMGCYPEVPRVSAQDEALFEELAA